MTMSRWIHRLIGVFLVIPLAGAPELLAALNGQQPDAGVQQAGGQQVAQLPDTPSVSLAQARAADPVPPTDSQAQPANTQPNASAPSAPAQEDSQPQANPLPAQNSQQPPDPTPAQNTPQQNEDQKKTPDQQQPAGAAAAQLGRTTGGAASKPAGAAMAPAKQRQSRSLLLKMGLLAAAGVAVGTVVGLTKATPSKPPGAH
ncbi:MAG: hypothetical protein DMG73_07910 [Acidobacteria bacterium]|nr:MAG: hypothetical protein DMG73_07910 [Acidobacteriota bacterium]